MISRPLRLALWAVLATGLAAGIGATVLVWTRGEMADHGMWRTVGWASAGLLLLAFQYPRKPS